MARPILEAADFHDEPAAFASSRRICCRKVDMPHCGEAERVGRLNGKTTRPGLCKCYACKKPFTVRMGTIFELSHLPLRYWLQVIHLMCASKKGISTREVRRLLNCSMRTAWHLTHRIREMMAPGSDAPKIGGQGKIVEADETFLSNSPKTKKRPGASGYAHKMAILSVTEREGAIRSTVLVETPRKTHVMRALKKHVAEESILHSDGSQIYKFLPMVESHEAVDHVSGQYARKNKDGVSVHVNTLEGFFSVFKRGMVGIYQHVEPQHMHRYTAEFDFRQSNRERLGINDTMRAEIALKGAVGKRLTYRTTCQ